MGNQVGSDSPLKEVNLAPDAGSVSKKRKTVPITLPSQGDRGWPVRQAPLRIILLGESGVGMTRIANGLARGYHDQLILGFHQAITDYYYADVTAAVKQPGRTAVYTRLPMYSLDTSCFPRDIIRRALAHTWTGVRCEGDDEESGLLSEEKDLLEELALEKALNQSYNDEMNPTWDPEHNRVGQFFTQVNVFVLVFSLVDPNSFAHLSHWKRLIDANPCFKRIPVVVVGTKTDQRALLTPPHVPLAGGNTWNALNPLTSTARGFAETISSDMLSGLFSFGSAPEPEASSLGEPVVVLSPLMQLDRAVFLDILRRLDCDSLLNVLMCCHAWNTLITLHFEELFSTCSLNSPFVTRQQGIRLARMLGASKYIELNCLFYQNSQERSRLQSVLAHEHFVVSSHSNSQPEIDFLWACLIRTAVPEAQSVTLGKFD